METKCCGNCYAFDTDESYCIYFQTEKKSEDEPCGRWDSDEIEGIRDYGCAGPPGDAGYDELVRCNMEYGYCPFCGKTTWCKKKKGRIFDDVVEYLICFDCEQEKC